MKSIFLAFGLVAMLAVVPAGAANSLMRDIWTLVLDTPAPGDAADVATLAGRTQALYLANGFEAEGEPGAFAPKAVRILAWTRFFMGPTASDINDLQLFRLLRLAADPSTNTLAYLRGAYGTVLVSNYVAALSASDTMAIQLLEISDVEFEPSRQSCIESAALEQALLAEFDRRREIYETSLVLNLGSARSWWETSFSRVPGEAALRLDEFRVDDQSVSFVLETGCGAVVLEFALTPTAATPVVQIGQGPLSDAMVELNRYILAEASVR